MALGGCAAQAPVASPALPFVLQKNVWLALDKHPRDVLDEVLQSAAAGETIYGLHDGPPIEESGGVALTSFSKAAVPCSTPYGRIPFPFWSYESLWQSICTIGELRITSYSFIPTHVDPVTGQIGADREKVPSTRFDRDYLQDRAVRYRLPLVVATDDLNRGQVIHHLARPPQALLVRVSERSVILFVNSSNPENGDHSAYQSMVVYERID
ncbi:hypothetical protein [Alteriqipengyuania lutimaris]|uniref:Uncharacterized protein n=1 Tax=Alteriqipengyuania lutimaris TaxID=1538146 RepID=A0A395LLU1_9SPHN|nr:hypothetical protein [Alteriqipengyuania lutimaris]MBB3033280.1 hypothetical protein [Alteriqipengyuania lutimaris]RDS77679.1 hypothetical protein DL238_08730 [Alteriqipengyuania lutimaris]